MEAENDVVTRLYIYKDGSVTVVETDFECELLIVPPFDEDSHVDYKSRRVVDGNR